MMFRSRRDHPGTGLRGGVCAAMLGALMTVAAPLEAQPPAREHTAELRPAAALMARQELVGDRLRRLEDRLYRLRQAAAEQDPSQVRRLERAIERSRELLFEARVGQTLDLLDENQLEEALPVQRALEEDLHSILRILNENVAHNGYSGSTHGIRRS